MQCSFFIESIDTGLMFRGIFFILAFIFMVFSLLGWVLELFFRRIFTAKKWMNPGFLKGPCLPIYGFGIMALYVYVTILKNWEHNFGSQWIFDLVVILGIGVLMTVIELIAGIIFIEGMHIRLWDYSKRWGNYKGIICPLFSLLWTIAGALFYYLLYAPITDMIFLFLELDWFELATFLMGVYYGILIMDFAISMRITTRIKKFAAEKNIVVRFENFKANVSRRLSSENIKAKFLSPFRSPHALEEHLQDYFNDTNETKEQISLWKKKKKEERK